MRLHLGCGDNIKEGFLNIDMRTDINLPKSVYLPWNLVSDGLPPLGNAIIDDIHSEHLWEHLTLAEGVNLINVCRDRLASGGVFRLALPDFRKLATAYVNRDWDFFKHCMNYAPNGHLIEIVNFSVYQRYDGVNAEHKTMWDVEFAIYVLERLGFKNVQEDVFDPLYYLEERRPYTFYVRGYKA